MTTEENQNRRRRPGLGVLELLALLVFVGVVIVGLLPQLDLHTARQRTRDKQSELQELESRLARLVKETTTAEIELENATRRLREQSTLAERAQAVHDTEETLRKQAVAARVTEENLQRSLSQTNHLVSIETDKMRQDIGFMQTLAADLQAKTNALSVALGGLEARVMRLKQDELDAIQKRDQYNRDLAMLKADKLQLEADTNKADAERKTAIASLNDTQARGVQETQRLVDVQKMKAAFDAELAVANRLLEEAKKALAQANTSLKEAQLQTDKTRGESVTYQGQSDLAKKTLEILTKEQKDLQRQIDAAKAETVQLQANLTRARADSDAIDLQAKQATETTRKAREAETAARIGEAAAQQRLDDARREEVAVRKAVEELKKSLGELQAAIRAPSAKPKP